MLHGPKNRMKIFHAVFRYLVIPLVVLFVWPPVFSKDLCYKQTYSPVQTTFCGGVVDHLPPESLFACPLFFFLSAVFYLSAPPFSCPLFYK
jgi:hypothetical protein